MNIEIDIGGKKIEVNASNKIVMAFTDPVDTDPLETRYRYFTDYFTGEGVHTYHFFDTVEEFIYVWLKIYDKPNGMWYWVLDKGKLICSGACDPNDIDIFREHWRLEDPYEQVKRTIYH